MSVPSAPTENIRAALRQARAGYEPTGPGRATRRRAALTPNPIVRFTTSLGNIDVELDPDAAPKNVANFLSYVKSGAYANSVVHRSVPGFIIQGGGYTFSNGEAVAIATQAPVANEFDLSNVRGTLAMAKAANDPNSATSQWFFNEADNASSLDSQDGGYTVIGQIVSSDGLAVMDAIGALQVVNDGAPFTQLPVIDYSSGAVQANNLVYATSVKTEAPHPAFFNGEVNLGGSTYSLTFPNGNLFGYYSYLSNEQYIYHYDLGYEYVFDAADGKDGVYFYDFASNDYLYTSPSYPFPYLYDFTLKSTIYYYANTSEPGHYTSSPRYFYDFATSQVITR